MISKDLDMGEQDRINKELEEFLSQIKEIRDGPTQPTVQGNTLMDLFCFMFCIVSEDIVSQC